MRTDPDAQAMQAAETALEDLIAFDRGQRHGTYQDYVAKANTAVATLRERLAQSSEGEAFYFYRHKDRVTWDEVPKEFCDNLADDPQFEFRTLYTAPTAAQTDAIRMGLERAAKLADAVVASNSADSEVPGNSYSQGKLDAAEVIAAAIRAIKPEDVLGGAK